MKRNKIYYLILIVIIVSFMTSCTSAVRFSSVKSKSSTLVELKPNNPAKQAQQQNRKAYFSELEKLEKLDKSNEYSSTDTDLLVSEAERWIGTKYIYGGESRSGTDCSGFIQSVFSSLGVSLPRTAASQYKYTKRVKKSDIRKGDLVFFENKGKVSHVGLIVGDGKMIHASTSRGVVLDQMNKPYYLNVAGYGRIPELLSVNDK